MTTKSERDQVIDAMDACELCVIRCAEMNNSVFQLKTAVVWVYEEARGSLKREALRFTEEDAIKKAAASGAAFYRFIAKTVGGEVIEQGGIDATFYKAAAGQRAKFYRNGYDINGNKLDPETVYNLLHQHNIMNPSVSRFYALLCCFYNCNATTFRAHPRCASSHCILYRI
jgi:hypothetical protein